MKHADDMERTLALAVGLITLLGASLVGVSTAAHASSSVELGINYLDGMVLDDTHGHLFISGGGGSSPNVIVLNEDGSPAGSIDTGSQPRGLGFDAASGDVYVAGGSDHTITVIDTATLSVSDTFTLTASDVAGITPSEVAFAGGSIWFYAEWSISGGYFQHGLGEIDPATGDVVVYHGDGYPGWYSPAVLATDPADPNILAVWDEMDLYLFDTSTSPPTLEHKGLHNAGITDLVITPDGNDVLVAGGGAGVHAYSLNDLSDDGSYPVAGQTVTVSDDGTHVAIGGSGRSVSVFPTGTQTPNQVYKTQTAYSSVPSGGLVFNADTSKLFIVNGPPGDLLHLDILDGPTRGTPMLTLSSSASTVTFGHAVKLTAHLGPPATTANTTVALEVTPYRSATSFKQGTIDDAGTVTFTVKPQKKTTYRATWSGDEAYVAGASKSVTVAVRVAMQGQMDGGYATKHGFRLYHYTAKCPIQGTGCPRYELTVKPNHDGRCVVFRAEYHNAKGWHRAFLTECRKLNRQSSATIIAVYADPSVKGVPLRIRGQFDGDKDHLRNDAAWSYFKVTN